MKKYLLLTVFFTVSIVFTVYSQSTYYWVGGVGPSNWGTAANWNTTKGGGGLQRTTPATTDILIFDGSDIGAGATGAVTVNNLVSQTVAQLKFVNSANVTMGHSSTRTITIGGGTGDDYIIEAGCEITVGYTSFASAVTLLFNAGTTGRIAGTLTLQLGSHKITPATEAECITFTGSSIFNHNVSSGSAFGNATAVTTRNNVIFQNGATFNFGGGSNPFVATAPGSVTQFQSGSNYVHNSTGAPSVSGRYYGNFILNGSISSASGWGYIESLTIKAGRTLTLTTTGRLSIAGNLTVEPTASLVTTGASGYPDLLLIGNGSLQTVDFGSSTPTFRSISVGADANVIFASNCTIDPQSVTSGNTSNVYGQLDLSNKVITGANTAIINVRSESVVNTSLTSALSANSNTIATGSSSGVSNGMLVNLSAFPPNTYIIGTSSGTFTLSNYSTSALPSGTNFTITNDNALLATSNTGGLESALPTFSSYVLNGGYRFNAPTTTPFPASIASISPESLIINANVTLNKPVNLLNELTVSSGILTTNDNLTLRSTASGTARIAAGTGSYISGNVTTETFIPGGRRAFRFLSHPFTAAQAMSSLVDDIFVTGAGAGFDATTTNNPSSFWFNDASNAWTAFTSTSDASWAQHRGARVLVRGDRTQTATLTGGTDLPNAVTLDVTGTVNTGNQNISLSNAGNFHFVGNPYPSPTDIGTVIDATSDIGTTYWVWDANAVTRGAYVPRTVSSGAYNLAMNGAFFVQPTASTTLAFTESNKQPTATANLFRTQATQNQLELQVNYNGTYADKLFVRNDATATAAKQLSEDGTKLMNPDVNMFTLATGNETLTLDARPIASTTIIPMGFTSTLQSSFEIVLNNNTLNNGLPIVLKDKYLNVEHVLTANSPYNFAVTNDAASQGNDRFELMFRTSAALPTNFVHVAAQQKGSAIEVTFTTANEQNMQSYEIEESKDGSNFTKGTMLEAKNAASNNYNWLDANIHNGNNYYRVKAIEKNGTIKYSQVVRVNVGKQTADFAVYPNPVKGGIVNLQLTDIDKGIYTVKIYNNIGQEITGKTINHNGGSATQSISIGNVATGKYNMVITNGTSSVTKTVIVE